MLHNFGESYDGVMPVASLTNVGGVLYGTTLAGGASPDGTVFKIRTSGAENVLHSFTGGSNGENAQSGLTNVDGTLYGMTPRGGSSKAGTIFSFSL